MVVKVGPKERHVTIPEGWAPVTEGNCQAGDMFLNVGMFPQRVQWVHADEFDIGDTVACFDLLIREKEGK